MGIWVNAEEVLLELSGQLVQCNLDVGQIRRKHVAVLMFGTESNLEHSVSHLNTPRRVTVWTVSRAFLFPRGCFEIQYVLGK